MILARLLYGKKIDLVINFYYLNRNLCPKIIKALKIGGLLIFETYNYKHLCVREDFSKFILSEYILFAKNSKSMARMAGIRRKRKADL